VCPVVVGGDFNVAAQDLGDHNARRLAELLTSFDMKQHVSEPTQIHGNTLDLVLTPADLQPVTVDVEPAGMFSDHALVVCRLPLDVAPVSVAEKLVRGWRRVDRAELRRVLEDSALRRPPPDDADVNQLFTAYNTVLRDVADHLAPLRSVRRQRGRLSPWFDAECRSARRDCRRLERRYRRTRSLADRRLWVEATRRRFDLHRRKKDEYWRQRLVRCDRSSALLWRSLSSLLGRDRDVSGATDHTADGFAVFFAHKVDAVRANTAGIDICLVVTVVFPAVH